MDSIIVTRCTAVVCLAAMSAIPFTALMDCVDAHEVGDEVDQRIRQLESWVTLAKSLSASDRQRAVELAKAPKSESANLLLGWRTPDTVEFQRRAKPLVDDLARLLDDPNPTIVSEALSWLYDIGPEASCVAPILESKILADFDRNEVAFDWIATYIAVVPEEQPVGPFLIKLIDRYLNGLSSGELAQFELHLSDNSLTAGGKRQINGTLAPGFGVAMSGYATVLATHGHTRCEIPYLLRAASSKYPTYIRAGAIAILATWGPESHSAVPQLVDLLGDSNEVVRRMASHALLQIEPTSEMVATIAEHLRLSVEERTEMADAATTIREERAAAATGGLGGTSEDNAAWITQMIRTRLLYGNGFVRRQTLYTMQEAPAVAREWEDLLVPLLDHADIETRRLAAELLGVERHSPPSRRRCRRHRPLRHRRRLLIR